MQFTTFGRTGLKVSVVGLGTGGPSRLGLARGRPVDSVVSLIQFGLDRGINLIDVAATYGTDKIVADAIRKRRHEVVLSAKTVLGPHIWMLEGTRTASRVSARFSETTSFVTSDRVIEKRLDASLRRLKTDHIEIFSLHGVTLEQYAAATDRLLPALLRLKEKGKIRSVGITEAFGASRPACSRTAQDFPWASVRTITEVRPTPAGQIPVPCFRTTGSKSTRHRIGCS